MPIFERDNQKIHFIHIPKTGGTSLRGALIASGWRDATKGRYGSFRTWHVPYMYWKEWDEVNKCDFEFAIVRNPVSRMSSLIQMWLRSFWLDAHAEAYESGGNYGKEMRKLFVRLALIKNDATEECFHQWVGSVTLPDDNQHRHSIADANGLSIDAYEACMWDNIYGVMKRCAGVSIGYDIDNCSWADLLKAYMISGAFSNMESPGLSPCPMFKYVGPNTHVYRFEEYSAAFNDLIDKDILDESTINTKKNHWRSFQYANGRSCQSRFPLNWFYEIYKEDFAMFDYDLDTPLPDLDKQIKKRKKKKKKK